MCCVVLCCAVLACVWYLCSPSRYPPTVFPPSAAECSSFQLSRCLRLLPHHQDTGGFFIALLHKRAELPNADRDDVDASLTAKANTAAAATGADGQQQQPLQQQQDSDNSSVATAVANAQLPTSPTDSLPVQRSDVVDTQLSARSSHAAADAAVAQAAGGVAAAGSDLSVAAASPVQPATSHTRRLIQPRKEVKNFSDDPFIPINEQVAQQIMSATQQHTATHAAALRTDTLSADSVAGRGHCEVGCSPVACPSLALVVSAAGLRCAVLCCARSDFYGLVGLDHSNFFARSSSNKKSPLGAQYTSPTAYPPSAVEPARWTD